MPCLPQGLRLGAQGRWELCVVPMQVSSEEGAEAMSDIITVVVVLRVGKRAAGRLLDGREWSQMPEMKA